MSETMKPQPFAVLLRWILAELESNRSVFGLPQSLFFAPREDSLYASRIFGQPLATPIGPAAGPHTQLAQNIVCAWLSGGRFIELKTVQIMDELDIPRPCIDLAPTGEGYNVEWSQELKLDQSAAEYVKAWALVHILHHVLGPDNAGPAGTIFNMSVGYNLAGIQSPAMVRFMDRLVDASAEIDEIRGVLRAEFPQLAGVEIPARLTDNVTLSTMHGCPPDEIERIARFLLKERGLHTLVKLNPTLLGRDTVLGILHDDLGYRDIAIPDAVFEHDLKYERAVSMIRTLQATAAARGLTFGVKLSNTLAMTNHRGVLPGSEMYMSGRALYPLTLCLFDRLAHEFDGRLAVSYSGGADALNVAELLAAGARPVTVASDLLKPGGYSRLRQYLETVESAMRERGAANLDDLARDRLASVARAAAGARRDPRYARSYQPYGPPKVDSPLGAWDCIQAPCSAQCAVCQDVPEYAWLIARGEDNRALEVILSRNPLPGITGYVCTQLCQTRCTRSNYDEPIAIRALKRFAAEKQRVAESAIGAGIQNPESPLDAPEGRGMRRKIQNRRVAIVGSGPSGLAAAYFLALSGVGATIYEARDVPGGMPAIAPGFRLPPAVVAADVERIRRMGVEIVPGRTIDRPPEALLDDGFDAVFVACGMQRDARLGIPGEETGGVLGALELLERVARGERPEIGPRVLVVGGGNTAMDGARTARRLAGRPVTVVYRRTRAEMPAGADEIADLLAEGNAVLELASPVEVVASDGRAVALRCVRNELGAPDAGGRRMPVPVAGSEFDIEADTIVVAVGQQPDLAFLGGSGLEPRGRVIMVEPATGLTAQRRIYAGGDVVRGPETIIAACADGRRAAEAICRELGIEFAPPPARVPVLTDADIDVVKRVRARQSAPARPGMLPAERRDGYDVVEQTLAPDAARHEAGRCLQCSSVCDKCVEVCPNRANYAYHVAPVRLAVPRLACRDGRLIVAGEDEFRVAQSRQIVHIDDFCNKCGNCATFCVHQGKPYQDKPRLFLRESDYRQETDNAYFVERYQIHARRGGREARLDLQDEHLTYENEHVRLTVAYDFKHEAPCLRVERWALKEPFEGELSLVQAAEMATILGGVISGLPFLLR